MQYDDIPLTAAVMEKVEDYVAALKYEWNLSGFRIRIITRVDMMISIGFMLLYTYWLFQLPRDWEPNLVQQGPLYPKQYRVFCFFVYIVALLINSFQFFTGFLLYGCVQEMERQVHKKETELTLNAASDLDRQKDYAKIQKTFSKVSNDVRSVLLFYMLRLRAVKMYQISWEQRDAALTRFWNEKIVYHYYGRQCSNPTGAGVKDREEVIATSEYYIALAFILNIVLFVKFHLLLFYLEYGKLFTVAMTLPEMLFHTGAIVLVLTFTSELKKTSRRADSMDEEADLNVSGGGHGSDTQDMAKNYNC